MSQKKNHISQSSINSINVRVEKLVSTYCIFFFKKKLYFSRVQFIEDYGNYIAVRNVLCVFNDY